LPQKEGAVKDYQFKVTTAVFPYALILPKEQHTTHLRKKSGFLLIE